MKPGMALLLAALCAAAHAEGEQQGTESAAEGPDRFSISGSFRLRYESMDNTFRIVGPGQDELLLSRLLGQYLAPARHEPEPAADVEVAHLRTEGVQLDVDARRFPERVLDRSDRGDLAADVEVEQLEAVEHLRVAQLLDGAHDLAGEMIAIHPDVEIEGLGALGVAARDRVGARVVRLAGRPRACRAATSRGRPPALRGRCAEAGGQSADEWTLQAGSLLRSLGRRSKRWPDTAPPPVARLSAAGA